MAEVKKIIEFKELPEPVKNWLSSTLVTNIILGINRKYGFLENVEKVIVIPGLVFDICTKEIEPREVIQKLKNGLGITDSEAQSLAEEIKIKVLKPIGSSLFGNVGIDIEAITSMPTQPLPSTPLMAPPPAPRPAPIAPPVPQKPMPAPTLPPLPPVVKIPINVSPSKPPLPPIQNKNLEP